MSVSVPWGRSGCTSPTHVSALETNDTVPLPPGVGVTVGVGEAVGVAVGVGVIVGVAVAVGVGVDVGV
jgi:hypothetical protein